MSKLWGLTKRYPVPSGMLRGLVVLALIGGLISGVHCAGATGVSDDDGGASFTEGPVELPVPIAKMDGGVDETKLAFSQSGSSETCSGGTLTGALRSETPVGSAVLVFQEGECVDVVETESDRTFKQDVSKGLLGFILSYMAAPNGVTCEDLETLSNPTHFIIDCDGNIKVILTNEQGIVSTEISVIPDGVIYQREETDGSRAVRTIDRGSRGTSELAGISLARGGPMVREGMSLAGILPEDQSGIGNAGEVCLVNIDTGAIVCDGHVFFSDRERNLHYPPGDNSWMAAAYMTSDSKMTIALMDSDNLSLMGGSEGILNIPSGEKDVQKMTFTGYGDSLFVAKEFTDGTAVLQRYNLETFLTSLSNNDVEIVTLYTSSEPIADPVVRNDSFLFLCGAEGAEEVCYSNVPDDESTPDVESPFYYTGTLPDPTVVDFGSSVTRVYRLVEIGATTYDFSVCETDAGVYVIDKNHKATLLDAEGSYPITDGGGRVIYLRPISGAAEVWEAYIGYLGTSILSSDEEGLFIVAPVVNCDGGDVRLDETPTATCSDFNFFWFNFSESLDTTTLDGTNNIYFMREGTKYPSKVTTIGTTGVEVRIGSTNPFSSSGTVTLVVDGNAGSTEPILSKTGNALNQDYEYSIIIP